MNQKYIFAAILPLFFTSAVRADAIGSGFDDPSGFAEAACETDCTTTQDSTVTTETETSLWQQLLELLGTDESAE